MKLTHCHQTFQLKDHRKPLVVFWSILALIGFTLGSMNAGATTNFSCQNLFNETAKTYKVSEFIIPITKKKESKRLLEISHEKLMLNTDLLELKNILLLINESGLSLMTPAHKVTINKFRQNTSFMRSVFQTVSETHQSPKKFAQFVRDFGHLKDMVNINESAQAQKASKKLLKKFVDLDFNLLLADAKPASQKSIHKYFKSIISQTQTIMTKKQMEIDELHTVRKNMRDILRYLQIQNESNPDTEAIQFLKKFNHKLGELCDSYAHQIIRGELSEKSIVEFPENLRNKVDWFLAHHHYSLSNH